MAVEPLPVRPLSELRRRRSARWRSDPADVLPLSIAESDVDPAEPVVRALRMAIDRGDLGYAGDFAELAEAFTGFAEREWGWSPDPGRIVAVTDVGVGMVELLRTLDVRRVVVSTPVYPPFLDWVPEAGAELVDVPLLHERLDLPALDAAFATADAMLLCNPQNPTGTVHERPELDALVASAAAHGVVILSDEIHAPVALHGARVTPLLSVPGAAGHAITVTSASKAWNIAGLKCALTVSASDHMQAAQGRLPPDTRWRVGHLGVLASVAAFRAGDDWRARFVATVEARRAWFGPRVAESLPGLRLLPADATYLGWLALPPGLSGQALADAARQHGRVAIQAGEDFGDGGAGHVRVNLGTSEEVLRRGLIGIQAGLAALR